MVHSRIGLALLAATCVVRANAGHELASTQSELAWLDHGARARLENTLGRAPVVLTLCAGACSDQEGLALDLQYLARDPQLHFRTLSMSIDSHEMTQDVTFVLDPRGRVVRRLPSTSVEPHQLWLALRDASS